MSGVRKPKAAAGKAKAKPGSPRPLNPLPPDQVGPRLLVRLQAEKIMTKLRLREAWEGKNGWDFDELCAVVACALGEHFCEPGEQEMLKRVVEDRDAKLIARIQKDASPALTDGEGGTPVILAKSYEGLLILGLGTPAIPFTRKSVDDTAQLCHGLARCFDIEESRVNPRTFERAKQNTIRRYEEHLSRQAERRERAKPQPGGASALPQRILLRAAWAKLGLKLPSKHFARRNSG